MKIHLINLDRCPERLESFLARNPNLAELDRFGAIDGAEVPLDSLSTAGLIVPGIAYTPGAIGCALSHLALWDEARRQNQVITVCEDDAVLHESFSSHAEKLLAGLGTEWDVVVWGWNFDSVFVHEAIPGVAHAITRFDQNELRQNLGCYQSTPIQPSLLRLHRAFGTVGYSVTPRGASRLLEHCLPIRPMSVPFPGTDLVMSNCGIDIMMNSAYSSLSAFAAYPPLIVTANDHGQSTVQGSAALSVRSHC